MSYNVYGKFEGKKQGKFPGTTQQTLSDSNVAPSTDTEIINVNYRVYAPVDPKSGKPTSHRQHAPWTITIESDKNIARYMTALETGETMTCDFTFVDQIDENSGLQTVMTVKLINAHVSDFRITSGRDSMSGSGQNSKGTQVHDMRDFVEVAFVFDRIEISSGLGASQGKAVVASDWRKPATNSA